MPDNPQINEIVELITEIDTRMKKVHTNSLDLSFNELLDMRKAGELNITPDYQRLFQWSEGARSRFIESLLLEMPVPPIYVVEEEDGKYLLIDGLQRISSYLHMRGELDAPHLDPPILPGEKLILADCDIVKSLNGRTWDDLGTALQIRLKRSFVRVEVVRKGSDPRFKYHMFKRLNTGGALLSDQQVRNCTIRLLDPTFNDFIIELSKTENFQTCIETLTEERRLAAFDQELVLRFFALRNYRGNFKHDVADFLTEYMEGVSETDEHSRIPFNYEEERAAFLKTFRILAQTLGERSFSIPNRSRDALTKSFGIYQFEAFTVGIQPHLNAMDENDDTLLQRLTEAFLAIKLHPQFIRITTGGGKNSPGPLNERIGFVETRIHEIL
jgi:Protein of unknown function DUF262